MKLYEIVISLMIFFLIITLCLSELNRLEKIEAEKRVNFIEDCISKKGTALWAAGYGWDCVKSYTIKDFDPKAPTELVIEIQKL